MPLAVTAPLRDELRRALPERPFELRFWDGTNVPATTKGAPTFSFRSPQAIAHVLRAPGELGLGRAYVSGLLEVDDLDAAVQLVDEWRPPPLGVRDRVRLGLALVRACGLVRPTPGRSLRIFAQAGLQSPSIFACFGMPGWWSTPGSDGSGFTPSILR